MATPHTILVLCRDTSQREAKLGGVSGSVLPGKLIEVIGGTLELASSSAPSATVCIENSLIGHNIDYAYSITGEHVQYAYLQEGDTFYGFLRQGQNASEGSLLAHDGFGGLVVTTDAAYAFAKALTAVDNSLGSGYVRIFVQVTSDYMPAVAAALPAITVQPADDSIASGATATLTVTATGHATLHYQWYQGLSGITTTPVGTDAASYTTPALTADEDYWVKVYNTFGEVYSDTAHITVT